MLSMSELAMNPNRKVTTVCNGKKQEWDDREEAQAYFLEAMVNSDGAEHDRYSCIWFCQYHLTHFIRTRIMQRERYDHSRAFFELPEAAHRWRCRFFCWPSNSYNISRS